MSKEANTTSYINKVYSHALYPYDISSFKKSNYKDYEYDEDDNTFVSQYVYDYDDYNNNDDYF
ncbi:hypothetical protein [Wolbachia endosymbiont of Chironomus riparius]|uniref:hypothetical protein n=1 Tax=Wolbachia endosymbiont of Chironomus riparius TaxID=2883238 RepID=UPI00209D539C|nr:hypothetical protein [Wolbachia endosymbiont of Chironomus riparius]